MRYLLAIVSFALATVCLGYFFLAATSIIQVASEMGFGNVFDEITAEGWALYFIAFLAVAFFAGVGFLVAGLVVLKGKPNRQC